MATEILDRMPPFDLDAERGVIGSMMLRMDVCDDALLLLRPGDFYDDAHRVLFSHLSEDARNGRAFDPTLFVARLRKANHLDTVGGAAEIHKICTSVPNAAHCRFYALQVRECAMKRELILACCDALRDAYDRGDAAEMVESASKRLFAIGERAGADEPASGRDIATNHMALIESRISGNVDQGVKTGFVELDKLTGGLLNTDLIIVAARPSMGKSAFAMNIAEHVAIHDKLPVLVFSLEMSSMSLADRLIASLSNVNSFRIRNGTLNVSERQRIIAGCSAVAGAPLFVLDSSGLRVATMAAHARRVKRKHGLALVIVDYLQLAEPDDHRIPRQEQVARMTKSLKALAKELCVPIIVVAQLNRQTDGMDGLPKLNHLRESGAIEQDADVVMFVHREDYQRTDKTNDRTEASEGLAKVVIAKQRNGPIGQVPLVWRKELVKFENAAPERLQKMHEEFSRFNDGDTSERFQ